TPALARPPPPPPPPPSPPPLHDALPISLLQLVLAGLVAAAGPLSQTFGVSADHAWTTTERVLKVLGWDIDKADREIGWLTTDSRSEEERSELQSRFDLVCRLLLGKKNRE